MEKRCVIDIGTNSIRMLIAEISNGHIIRGIKELEMTRIGEGVDKTGRLSEEAMERSIKALIKFKNKAIDKNVVDIRSMATSAVRDADNREEFIRRVWEQVGINVEVLSGKMEAELGFKGVIGGINKDVKDILVIDIGGGSTELIVGNNKGIKYLTSLNVGAVRMTDKHIINDPITPHEMNKLESDIASILSSSLEEIKNFEIEEVVGIGGTATTLAAVSQELEVYDRNKVHNYILNLNEIKEMVNLFASLSNADRKKIKGLQPKRADIILAGSRILYEILWRLGKSEIRISDYDNLEGYIYSCL